MEAEWLEQDMVNKQQQDEQSLDPSVDASEKVGQGSRPDVLAIMNQIRKRVQQDAESCRDQRKSFSGASVDINRGRKAGELVNSEELRYLNAHYAFGPQLNLDSVTSHRPGLIGKTIVRVKRKLLALVWDLLKDYFAAEREFHANLVRFLNDTSQYVDARDSSNFWEIIRKIDVDVTKVLERIERINDEQMAALRSNERLVFDVVDQNLRGAIGELRSTAAQHGDQLGTLESVVRGLEGIIASLKRSPQSTKDNKLVDQEPVPDFSYLMLENRYRGSEQEIRTAMESYVEIFRGAQAPILEIGPGRGELLELLRERGIAARGVDYDRAMVEQCHSKGLEVLHGDGLKVMEEAEPGSLGGVIAIQVVEHLNRNQLDELFRLCFAKVRPGGRVVFETINPRSLLALSSNYFRDPTHVWPLHPDTLEYRMNLAGLKTVQVQYRSPVPAEAELQKLVVEPYMTPRWAHTIECMNQNFRQLNELLYGYQDYCIVGQVPTQDSKE